MSNRRMLFVFNPHSGKAMIRSCLYEIVDALTNGGYDVIIYPTKGPVDAYEKIRREGVNFDIVAVSGGDGTLNEAVRGVMCHPKELRPAIGYIPSGTTNDFASSLGISKEMPQAARDIVTGSKFECDVGRFNDQNYNYVAAFGAFTDVSYDTPQQYKNTLGHTAYILEGIKRISSIKSAHMKVEYEGGIFEDDFIYGMVSNTTSIGGMKENSADISLCDGLFEVLLVHMPLNLAELQQAVSGIIHRAFTGDMFKSFKTKSICFKSNEEIKWTLDGEYGGAHRQSKVENLHNAVTFIVPDNSLNLNSAEREY